jgi:Putative zinc-finger
VRALTISPHDEFLELCAVSTSGELTPAEQKKLQEHLAVCESCRLSVQQYEAIVDRAIPTIAAEETPADIDSDSAWSEEQAERAFFKRLQAEEQEQEKQSDQSTGIFPPPHRLPPIANESTWRDVWILYGAGILLFAGLSFYAYRVGVHRGTESAKLVRPAQSASDTQPTLEAQLSDAGHERQIARAQVEERDRIIADLRKQLALQVESVNGLKAERDKLEDALRSGDATRQDLAQQRTDLSQKLDVAVLNSQTLQQKLDSLAQQTAEDDARAKALDAKMNDLTRLLRDRETALNEKDELLAHDRDIRELMGARDLYIAEVHDVARDGQTQKTYGRVFYTKGKSLIFYAYDLGEQTDLKRASAFQAWGRRGPDREQALPLGVFYEDNASKNRWVLKCDDPKTLAQIDAVFVTMEPHGGSHKPSGKSLLFAYLKLEPNHP